MGIYEYNEEEHLRSEREYAEKLGQKRKLIELTCNAMKKGMTVPEIVELFDENIQVIQRIYDTSLLYAPNYDVDKILEEI